MRACRAFIQLVRRHAPTTSQERTTSPINEDARVKSEDPPVATDEKSRHPKNPSMARPIATQKASLALFIAPQT